MAKPRPGKKREPEPSAEQRELPMQLKVCDRLADASGEYEVSVRPYTTAAGKNAHVGVQRVDNPTSQ